MTSTIEVPTWLRDMYSQVDVAAIDKYIDNFAEDVELRFGNAPVIQGKTAVRDALAAGHAAHGMRHRFMKVWESGNATIAEFDAQWIEHDDSVREFPAVTIFEREDGLITHMRVYLDPNA